MIEDPRLLPVMEIFAKADRLWADGQYEESRALQRRAVGIEQRVRAEMARDPSAETRLRVLRDQYAQDEVSMLDLEEETSYILGHPA